MTWSKLGLLVPALTVGWLAGAAAGDEVAPNPAPASGAVADLPPDDPAALPSADAAQHEATQPAAVADQTPAGDAAAPAAQGSEPAMAAPADAAGAEAQTSGATAAKPSESEPVAPALGAIGYDSQGRQGRVHIVRKGDTLWHISEAYLGTPWVWPSIWRDNGQVANPHRIYPGDRIWITPNEMRKVSAEEAAELLSNLPPGQPAEPAAAEEVFPAAPAPEAAPAATPAAPASVHVSARESTGLLTAEEYEAAGSIVGRVPERVFMSQEDQVYIGVGEGSVKVGDQLTIFRTRDKVYDPDTGRLLGYHVEFLGYVEVTETHPEASLARIRMSTGEVIEGDRVTPRQPMPQDVALRPSPQVDGMVCYFPQKRVVIAWNDFVYLNRGSTDGLEVGSPLEVFRLGYTTEEPVRDERVQVPDRVIAKLVVVRVGERSSVALVTKATTELKLGDRFRGAVDVSDMATTPPPAEVAIPVDQDRARGTVGRSAHPASRRH
ncbi:MAG TPA: LysM peptidoglycan-binding domain-containing protein [Myxococcota bacterium]|nr:LysM peptidoglycan-binding domain-containing protein [Myxococcota bacterium]